MRTVGIERGKGQDQVFEKHGLIANLEEIVDLLSFTARPATHHAVGENVVSDIGRKLFATVIVDLSIMADQMFQLGFGIVLHAGGKGVHEDPLLKNQLLSGDLRQGRTQFSEVLQGHFASSAEQLIDRDLQFVHR